MMKSFLNARLFVLVGAAFLLAACDISLAADVTPPPDWSPTRAVEPVAAEVVYPLLPPDPRSGAAIYAENCSPCHGDTGLSDGVMADQLPELAPQLGDPAIARAARPVDWFAIVTNGNVEKLMPYFSGSLTDRQRWDVVAYARTLSVTDAELEWGQQVYVENCESCHGPQGAGDGPAASGLDMPDWADDPALLADSSDQELWEIVTAGLPGGMPSFTELPEEERWAVVSFVRSQTYARQSAEEAAQISTAVPGQPTQQPGVEETETAGLETGQVDISGFVVNASGGEIPAEMEVTLTGYDGMDEALSMTAPASTDGSFQFDQVEVLPGRTYLASLTHEDITYNSDVIHPDQLQPGDAFNNLVIEFYESTTDASALVADRMHLLFEPTETGTIQVVELLILNNTGDRVIIPAAPDQPVLTVDIPADATNLQFQDGEIGGQYIATETGFGDLHAFMPGPGAQLMFAYELPAARKIDLDVHVPLDVQAAVVMLPISGLKLSSPDLTAAGERPVQNMNLQLYTSAALAKGDVVEMTLTTGQAVAISPTTGLFIGGGALGILLIVAGIIFMRRRQDAEVEVEEEILPQATVEELLDAIIVLDDQYKAGELPEEAYRARRAELKDRLRALQENG